MIPYTYNIWHSEYDFDRISTTDFFTAYFINKDKVKVDSVELEQDRDTTYLFYISSLANPIACDLEKSGFDEYFIWGKYAYTKGNKIPVYEGTTNWTATLATGDVDNDGYNEIIVNNSAYSLGSDGTTFINKHTYLDVTTSIDKYIRIVIAGNFDNDCPMVEYVGHELCYTQPIPIYAIAAVPYYSELVGQYNYSPDDWGSSVSKSTEYTDGDSNSLGFSVGVSVGFETNFLFASSKTELGITGSFNHEWTNSMTINQEIEFSTGGAGDNFVVFTTIPLDTFKYKVLQIAQDAPSDGYKVGDIVTIEIPRTNSTYMVPLDYYNENNGTFKDIKVFDHKIGDPTSYPTEAEAEEIIAQYDLDGVYSFSTQERNNWTSYDVDWEAEEAVNSKSSDLAFFTGLQTLSTYNPDTVVGTCPTINISYTSSQTTGRAISAGVDISAKQEVKGGVGVKVTTAVELGLQYGHTWTSDISHGLTFNGTVGNLPTTWVDNNSHRVYSQGMFGYPAYNLVEYEDGSTRQETFWVLDYYVE